MDDKQMQKLIRQNAARALKAQQAAKDRADGRKYDPTLPPRTDDDSDRENQHFFKEMKKREF